MEMPYATAWQSLHGHVVVIDMASPYVCIGRLVNEQAGYLHLEDVDLHDLRDTSTTRERYVLECRLHGVRCNRMQVWINLRDVVGVSRLEDVIAD